MKLVRKAPQRGWIEVIAGSTFSGSSEEAIRRLHRAQIARQKVQIFKPLVDDRYSRDPDQGKRVIVAGLNQDDLGRPCEPMPRLLAIAEYITKTLASCVVCGDPANQTQRLVASGDHVLVGATGVYEARCRQCFDPYLATVERP